MNTSTKSGMSLRIELADKIGTHGQFKGRAIGNLYLVRGVERFKDGSVRTWTVSTHETYEAAIQAMGRTVVA